MSIRISLLLILIVFIFCDLQCYKEPLCSNKEVTRSASVLIQNPRKNYQVGDTIRLNSILPFSILNDLPDNSTPPQRYTATSSFELIEIIKNGPYDAQYGGAKFDFINSNGNLISRSMGAYENFLVNYDVDSLVGNYNYRFTIVPKFKGSFVIRHSSGGMFPISGECNRMYTIRFLHLWDVSSRNLEIPAELGISKAILCKSSLGDSGFYIEKTDERAFYFYVQ